MIEGLLAKIETYRNQREYKKNFELSRKIALYSELFYQENKGSYNKTKHPLHEIRLKENISHVEHFLPTGKPVHVNFGDSLTDLSRAYLKDINGIYSISGSWSCHIRDMVRDLYPHIIFNKIRVGKVSVGCLGGNPLLVYSNFDATVTDALETLDLARELFKESNLVVYGLPPVFNLYVTENTYQFDSILEKWSRENGAIFISLKEHFGKGFARLFPDTSFSSDGVHFNPEGAIRFNALLRDA